MPLKFRSDLWFDRTRMSQPHKFDDVVFCTDSKLTRYRRHTRAVVWRMSYRHALRFQDVSSAAAASVSALAFETVSSYSRFLNTILNSWCQNNLRLGNNHSLELFCKTRHSWTITIGYCWTKLILRRPNSVHWHYVYLFSNSILLSFECILADVLTVQCCVCRLSSVTCCIVAKRCILEQKLLYWQPIGSRIQEIDWYQNEWPWLLFRGRIKVMSTMAWHSTLNISETLEIEAWFQRTTIGNDMGYQMVTWSMTSRDPKGAVRQYGWLS